MTDAIILLPPGDPIDGEFAQQCMAHIGRRRDYRLYTILDNWADVMQVLATRPATVVVAARPEHLDPDRQPRMEFVGEETRRLFRREVAAANPGRRYDGRHRRPRIIT